LMFEGLGSDWLNIILLRLSKQAFFVDKNPPGEHISSGHLSRKCPRTSGN
jgi:hypothetical protein